MFTGLWLDSCVALSVFFHYCLFTQFDPFHPKVEDAITTSATVADILDYALHAIDGSSVKSVSHLAVRPTEVTEHRGLWQVRS